MKKMFEDAISVAFASGIIVGAVAYFTILMWALVLWHWITRNDKYAKILELKKVFVESEPMCRITAVFNYKRETQTMKKKTWERIGEEMGWKNEGKR